MGLELPFDNAAIERILPHRYPFLLVDRITEFELDKRIVGIKNVSLNERYLAHTPGEASVLPPTILTEAVAQVGAILILAKSENREKLPFFTLTSLIRALMLPLVADDNLRLSEKAYTPWTDTIGPLLESASLKEEAP